MHLVEFKMLLITHRANCLFVMKSKILSKLPTKDHQINRDFETIAKIVIKNSSASWFLSNTK